MEIGPAQYSYHFVDIAFFCDYKVYLIIHTRGARVNEFNAIVFRCENNRAVSGPL